MAFRIRHKPTGRFLKKTGSIGNSVNYALGGMDKYYPRQEALFMATTNRIGYLYATQKGAESTLQMLTIKEKHYWKLEVQPNDWEIVEG